MLLAGTQAVAGVLASRDPVPTPGFPFLDNKIFRQEA
jgi:hypothetical protein